MSKYSGPSNCERFDVRTNLKLGQKKIEVNPVLKLEQKLESRTKNHVVIMWLSRGRLLSLLCRMRSSSVCSPVTGSVSVSQIQSVFKRFIYLFIYLGYFYIIFNNIQKSNRLLERVMFEGRKSTVICKKVCAQTRLGSATVITEEKTKMGYRTG
jgi:hypothetical protein